MFRQLFSFDYNLKNIKLFLDNTLISGFSANIFVPLILFYLTYDFLNPSILIIWASLVIFIFIFRLFVVKKLFSLIALKSEQTMAYFKVLVGLIFLNTFLNLYIIFISIAHGIDSSIIFVFATIVITLTAGSIATLLSVFNVYLYFVIINMFSFIATVLYFDGSDFYLFAFILTIFTILNIRIGFKQYKLLNKITALNETFQTIYESSFDGIILFQNNRFKDCNNALVEMFGYSSKEELLQTHIKFTMPKYQDDGTLSIRKMLKIEQIAYKRGHYTFEWQHKKKNGEVFWVECALTKVYINDEEILHGVYRDINKRKELEKEKEQFQATLLKQVEIEVEKNRKKDKMIMYQSRLAQMGEMINMIAHQWRQPLNAITIATGAIHLKATRGTLDNQKAIEISNNITKFALHLSSTIDDFRNFFKTNKEMQKTTYNQLVTNVLVIIESSLKNHDIKLELEIQELIELTIYENEMKQVLLNLIKNAEDALIERAITNPTIKIFIDKRKLIVSDNAGGIHEDIIEKIFDPYFSTKMKKDGTGLGLYMSKIIIEDHCNGQLSVQNTKDGASFMILLGEEND